MAKERETHAMRAFAALLVQGMSQAAAYREVYPKSRGLANQAVAVLASRLALRKNVQALVKTLRDKADDAAVLSRLDLLKLHSEAVRKRFAAASRYVSVTPDGDVSLNMDPENMKGDPGIKKVKVRVEEIL